MLKMSFVIIWVILRYASEFTLLGPCPNIFCFVNVLLAAVTLSSLHNILVSNFLALYGCLWVICRALPAKASNSHSFDCPVESGHLYSFGHVWLVFSLKSFDFVFLLKSKLGYLALSLYAGTVHKGHAVCHWKDYSFARLNILFILLKLLLEAPNVAVQTIISAPAGCLPPPSVKYLYVITFNLWIFRSHSRWFNQIILIFQL